MSGLFIVVSLLGLMALGMPVAFALGMTALLTIIIFLDEGQLRFFGESVFQATNDFNLLAIPLFILMGAAFAGSRAGADLFNAGYVWCYKLRGGLAMCSVVACAVFAGLCGSSAATSAAIGRFAIPEMMKHGYSSRLATGAIAAGGTLGILIPPSVTLILYGVATEVSIGQLFLGGVIPGVLVTVLFCIWISIAARREIAQRVSLEAVRAAEPVAAGGLPAVLDGPGADATVVPVESFSLTQRVMATVRVIPFGLLIVGVLAMLYLGIATPSEAAAGGALLALVLVIIADRGMTLRRFNEILRESTGQTTMVMLIVAFSAILASVLSFLRIPQDLAALITDLDMNRWVVLLVINLLLLVLGFFLPPVSIILMTAPILLPVITTLGFSPLWFGVVMTLNMEMGLITPPVGVNLYVTKGVSPAEVSLLDVLRGSTPYVGVLAVAIVIMSIFPQIILWLPERIYG